MSGIIWPWERRKVQKELDSVEDMLESMFRPVKARPSFTADLRKKLVRKEGPLAKASLTTLEVILLISGAVVGTVVFLFTLIRSVVALVTGIRKVGGNKAAKPAKAEGAAPVGKLKTKKRTA